MENDFIKIIGSLSGALVQKGLTLAVAESCTGGAIADAITDVPGASRFFTLGVVCYSTGAKESVLGIDPEMLRRYGTVSRETAAAMADEVRKLSGASIALATTGVAGPDTLEGKEKGLVYIACSKTGAMKIKTVRLTGDRTEVKRKASLEALRFLKGVIDLWE